MDMNDPKFILSYLQGQLGDAAVVDVIHHQGPTTSGIAPNGEHYSFPGDDQYHIFVPSDVSRDRFAKALGIPRDHFRRFGTETEGVTCLILEASDYRSLVQELPPPQATPSVSPASNVGTPRPPRR
jgi:hypothetical protein